MDKPFKALLVEGTSGVGKSTLIDALIRSHASNSKPRKIRTLVHLAQSHTYGPLAVPEDKGTLTVDDNVRHLERIVGTLEWLHAGVQEHSRPWCFVLIDTLHLTHCVRPGLVGWQDVADIDRRLAALECGLLFLEASPGNIWERGIQPRINDQFILEYAKKFGSTNEEKHTYFVREQQTLASLFSASAMPKVALNGDGTFEALCEQAKSFWIDRQ
jgi:hypothetical protein